VLAAAGLDAGGIESLYSAGVLVEG
jgi:hypothetical protein